MNTQRITACRILIALATVVAAGCGRDGTPPSANGKPTSAPLAGAPQPKAEIPTASLALLMGVSELKKRLNEEKFRVLDARPPQAYSESHIPRAVSVDVEDWKAQALAEGGLHNAEVWAEKVGSLGIDTVTNVVVYAENPTSATRIWWTLKYVGIPNVAVLDGGWKRWIEEGGEVSSEAVEVPATRFTPVFQPGRLAEIGNLKKSIEGEGDEEVTVVDARSIEEYTGTAGGGQRKGHIPGAIHLEWKTLLSEDGRFRPIDELKQIFEEQGISPEETTVTYCQSGGRASLNAFALELAGYPQVRNYYRSWPQWSADDNAPVETEDENH